MHLMCYGFALVIFRVNAPTTSTYYVALVIQESAESFAEKNIGINK